MREIFVIYNKVTGEIDGGSGRVDREQDSTKSNGATMSERIPQILAKNTNRAVLYLPNQDLPNKNLHRIERGKIILKTDEERLPTETELQESRIRREIRSIAIQSLKDKEELPRDF